MLYAWEGNRLVVRASGGK